MTPASSVMPCDPVSHLKGLTRDYPRYTLKDKVYLGKVCEIYDGDTLDIILYLPDDNTFKRCRVKMHGYDSPEIHPRRDAPGREDIKCRALESMEALWQYSTNTELFTYNHTTLVRVECGDWDKYGRIFAKIYRIRNDNLDDIDFCVNEAMIANAFGIKRQ